MAKILCLIGQMVISASRHPCGWWWSSTLHTTGNGLLRRAASTSSCQLWTRKNFSWGCNEVWVAGEGQRSLPPSGWTLTKSCSTECWVEACEAELGESTLVRRGETDWDGCHRKWSNVSNGTRQTLHQGKGVWSSRSLSKGDTVL